MSRIYIWFRMNWLVLLAVLAAMWYAAISQGNSAAYLLMFFLGGVAMVSALHTHFALTRLRLRAGRIEPVFAGERIRVPAEAINLGRRRRFALAVAPGDAVFREAGHVLIPKLEAGAAEAVTLSLPARARGRYRVPRLALTTLYPLGFFRGWRYAYVDAGGVVYPAPAGSLPLPVGPALNAEVISGSASGGDDYLGARPYQIGESQRHVDWRAVARGQPLLVKQFAGTGSRRLWLDYGDLSGIPGVEARLAQLSQWIVDADHGGLLYGLRLPGGEFPPARGNLHYHQCLEALAAFEA